MKKEQYTVNAKLRDFWVDQQITATSLDDAVERAKTMEVKDFIDIHGDWIDGKLEIIGVIKTEG